MADLSLIIPARSEMFLKNTVEDAISAIRGDTEIICVLDGNWPDPPVMDHPRVTLIHHSQSIGQRAGCNEAARYSRAKYIAKCDGHCSFDEGFDVKLMADMQDDWTMVPVMRNLHVFDWVCEAGHRRYQGPSGPCQEKGCGKPTKKEIRWIGKTNPQSTIYVFDPEPHFQYGNKMKDREEYKRAVKETGLTETMSLQGSFWMMTREKYLELGMNDEAFGSWGSQGLEVAIKTWTSGGKVMCSHKTWYGHQFRTQGGDFGFPYPISGRQVERAKKRAKEIFFTGKWSDKQIYPVSWLVERFWPVPFWTEDDLKKLKESESVVSTTKVQVSETVPDVPTSPQPAPSDRTETVAPIHLNPSKGLCFYTDNRVDSTILSAVQAGIKAALNGHRLVSVSLKPMDFGENIVLNRERGYLSMAKQQLAGIQALDTEIIFMVEHDCIYPKEHFDFTPPDKDTFYYDLNWFKVRISDGQALHFRAHQVSGLCAYKDILVEYFQNRIRMIESGKIGGRRHFEPGTGPHRDDYDSLTSHKADTWYSPVPYVDIRHDKVVTRNIFDPSGYRGRVKDWKLCDEIPSWGVTKGRFNEWLEDVREKLEKG